MNQRLGQLQHKIKPFFFWLILLLIPTAITAIALSFVWQQWQVSLQPAVIAYMATHLPEAEKQQMYREMQDKAGGMFMEIPEPLVGRVASPGFHGDLKDAPVVINAEGMRSAKAYGEKAPDVFRIVCLGDSFVFGTGVPENTRFCNQMEAFYRDNHITVNGKQIETLAVGLPSYTMVQEASYLTARLSLYAPDVVILSTVHNDITDSAGVTSFGGLTTEYSTDHRELGGAVFSNQAAVPFGQTYYTALTTDLSLEARARWDSAFTAVRRLAAVQLQREGKILLSVLQMPARHNQYFYELYKQHAKDSGLPYVMVNFWQGKKTRLPNDGHPNAYGHELIAAHYIQSLSELGWVPVPEAQLPKPEAVTVDVLNPPPDTALLAQQREQFIAEHLASHIDFTNIGDDGYGALLGGFFPEKNNDRSTPWASVRAAFLLKVPEINVTTLHLTLQLPDRVELFPFLLSISADGVRVNQQTWSLAEKGKIVTLSIPVLPNSSAMEVLLETPQYFSGLQDHRMKSYQILSASLE
jgi:lysophospholipase L1-like esterase